MSGRRILVPASLPKPLTPEEKIAMTIWMSAIFCTLLPAAAFAVDGVVLIDHNRALAGNVTPGDTLGYPVTISVPGSYRLSGNLNVANSNTNGILLLASHVTIDLNGFAILGPNDCVTGECTLNGIGSGITNFLDPSSPSRFNIKIRNGTIAGMGANGIFLHGSGFIVEDLLVRNNGLAGIGLGANDTLYGTSIVRHNIAEYNRNGIVVSSALVSDNLTQLNRNSGIEVIQGRAVNNVSMENSSYGLAFGTLVSYSGNVVSANKVANIFGGVNMGGNLCAPFVCPN